jgi:hypothetical protein
MATEMGLAARLRSAQEHQEGALARSIEDETAKIPSDRWLWAALGSMGVSLALFGSGRKSEAMFVGQWAAPLLAMGLYNKMVKVAGSDQLDR